MATIIASFLTVAQVGLANPPFYPPRCTAASSLCVALPRGVLVGVLQSKGGSVREFVVDEVHRNPGTTFVLPKVGETIQVTSTSLADGPAVAVVHPGVSNDLVTVVGSLVDGRIVHDPSQGLSVPRDAAIAALLEQLDGCSLTMDNLSGVDCSPVIGDAGCSAGLLR